MLGKFGVRHNVATPYHPLTSGHVEGSNRKINQILAKIVNVDRTNWSMRLDYSPWSYLTAYKTSIGISSYKLVYGKFFHLLVELENKTMWVMKRLNFDWTGASEQRIN